MKTVHGYFRALRHAINRPLLEKKEAKKKKLRPARNPRAPQRRCVALGAREAMRQRRRRAHSRRWYFLASRFAGLLPPSPPWPTGDPIYVCIYTHPHTPSPTPTPTHTPRRPATQAVGDASSSTLLIFFHSQRPSLFYFWFFCNLLETQVPALWYSLLSPLSSLLSLFSSLLSPLSSLVTNSEKSVS